jgi:hypothetical protein
MSRHEPSTDARKINGHGGTVPVSISGEERSVIVIGKKGCRSGEVVRGDVYFKINFLESLEWFVG